MGLSDALIQLGAAANGNPFLGKEKDAFSQLAQQMQSQADQAQGPVQPGQQNAADPLTNYKLMAAKMAAIDPTKYGANAMAMQDPLSVAAAQIDNQIKSAQAANTSAEAQQRTVHHLPNGQMLVLHPDGSHDILGPKMARSPEGQKIQDLIDLQSNNTSAGTPTPQPSQAGANPPGPDINSAITNLENAALRTPEQQNTANEAAKNRQDLVQKIQASKAAISPLNQTLSNMMSYADDVPFGETAGEQAKLSNSTANVPSAPGYDGGKKAQAYNKWQMQDNAQILNGLGNLIQGGGMRADIPIVHAVQNSNGIDPSLEPNTKVGNAYTLKATMNNHLISLQNQLNAIDNPEAKPLPLQSLDAPSVNSQYIAKAQKKLNMSKDQVTKMLHAKGFMVQD